MLWFALGVLTLVFLLFRRRIKRGAVALLVFAGVPSAPALAPLEYLFPGRKTPPDAMNSKPAAGVANPHTDTAAPTGLRRSERPTRGTRN